MPLADDLFQRVRDGDRGALARAVTLLESSRAEDRTTARRLVELSLPHSGGGLRLGITGIPGVGKSTLIDALGVAAIERGHSVAVLAVDPSSARSGGSILGDKTRMERLAQRPEAFVRPTAASGALGGVARRTRETILLCEAAGFSHVLVETVGVGQSELDVDRMTDLNLLLLITGAGDELQGIKRGIMESADVLVLTKVDAAGSARAKEAQGDLRNAIGLLPPRSNGRRAGVWQTDALTGKGIVALWDHLQDLHRGILADGALGAKRQAQAVGWFEQAVDEGLRRLFEADEQAAAARTALAERVSSGALNPFQAADELLGLFRKGGAPLP